jgi:hypothetical protein
MSLAYQNRTVESCESAAQRLTSLEERRDQIFGLYVERMFQRKKSHHLLFPKDKVIGWLSWLARKMREHSLSVFMVEGLQPSWLASTKQRISYGTFVGLIVGLFAVLIFGVSVLIFGVSGKLNLKSGLLYVGAAGLAILLGCWTESRLKNGIVAGLIDWLILALVFWRIYGLPGLFAGLLEGLAYGAFIGLIAGLGVGSLNRIPLVEVMSWNWRQFRLNIPGGLIPGFAYGLPFGLVFGLATAAQIGESSQLNHMLLNWLSYTLIFGLLFGLFGGLQGGLTYKPKESKALPNEGIELSRKNAAIAAVIGFAILGGLIWLVPIKGSAIFGGPIWFVPLPPVFGFYYGLMFGLISGLDHGGSTVVKHYSLRLTLWLDRCTPIRFIKLLDHCATLVLLKKVGGSYIFVHRMLLEYFARADV